MSKNLTRILSLFLCLCLILEQGVFAQTIDLSHYFARNPAQTIPQSDKFRPLHLRYISYDNQANDFKILLDKGDAVGNGLKPFPTLEDETKELMKYFFIGLALPNEKFWVNLRPDSPDNILDPDLEKTDIGRIFLEADLQLKKDTSGMTSPQTKEGKEYWDKLYKKAGELFGSENITIPTITRPWIVPNEIIIREAPDNAYIYKATLKVMLEEDYLNQKTEIYNFSDPRLKELNEYSAQLIKETIIPKLTYAVNTAKRYAGLRQVYYSLILAQWFKQKYGPGSAVSSLGSRVPGLRSEGNSYIELIDSGNLANLASSQPYDTQNYFQQYHKSFQDGEYNLQEPVYTPMGQSVRRYVSGGIMIVENIPEASSVIAAKKDLLVDKENLISLSSLSLTAAFNSDDEAITVIGASGSPLSGDKEKKRLLSQYKKVEKFISSFSREESRYQAVVSDLESYIFKNKKEDFWAWMKKFRELEYLDKGIMRDIDYYRNILDKESLTHRALSHYREEFSFCHQYLTQILTIYSDYRYYRSKVPYLQEWHLKAEAVWQEWQRDTASLDAEQKEIAVLRQGKNNEKAEFRERLRSWAKDKLGEDKRELSGLFEKLLYREVFINTDGELSGEKKTIVRKAIDVNFSGSNYSSFMKERAVDDILRRLLEENSLYNDAVGNLYYRLKDMEDARLLIARDIGKEIKPVSSRETVKKAFYAAGAALIPVGLSLMFWFQGAKDLPRKIENRDITTEREADIVGVPSAHRHDSREEGDNKKASLEKQTPKEPEIVEEIIKSVNMPIGASIAGQQDKMQEIREKLRKISDEMAENGKQLGEIRQKITGIDGSNEQGMKELREIAKSKEPVKEGLAPSNEELERQEWEPVTARELSDKQTDITLTGAKKEIAYGKPPQETLRDSGIYSSGGDSDKKWVAQYKGKPPYLGQRRYSDIDPVKGVFRSGISQSGKESKAYTSSGQAKSVIMEVPSDNQKGVIALVPPGFFISGISVPAESGVKKVDIYSDPANGIWYLGYDRPAKKIKIEIRPIEGDDFYPVRIVDEEGNPLSPVGVWGLLEKTAPAPVLEILQKANGEGVSLGEKEEAIRKIMGEFTYSVNPLLNELRQKSGFLANAFTDFALHCQGAAMLNALLSCALGIPLEVWDGYMVSNGNAHTPGHTFNRDRNGDIKDPVGYLDGRSPFYEIGGLSADDWGKELEYLKNRASRIFERLSYQEQEEGIKRQKEEMARKMEQLNQELNRLEEGDIETLERYYSAMIEQLRKAHLNGKSWERLIGWAQAVDFTDVNSSKELWLKADYVLAVLELAALGEPYLFDKIPSAAEGLYNLMIQRVQDKGLDFSASMYGIHADLTQKNNLPYIYYGVSGNDGVVSDLLRGRQSKVSEDTLLNYVPEEYVQGYFPRKPVAEDVINSYKGILSGGDLLVYTDYDRFQDPPVKTSFPGGARFEGSWAEKNRELLKDVENVEIAFSSPEGELILIVRFSDGKCGIIGPWAERYSLFGKKFDSFPDIDFLPDGSGRWYSWDGKSNIGTAIEGIEELEAFKYPIAELILMGNNKDWIAKKEYEPNRNLYVSSLLPKDDSRELESYYLIKGLPENNLFLAISHSHNVILGNIAVLNGIDGKIDFSGYKTLYLAPDGKAIIKLENYIYDERERGYSYRFAGLGAKELGIDGERKFVHYRDSNYLLQDIDDRTKVVLQAFPLWEKSPSRYKAANELAGRLFREGKIVQSASWTEGKQVLLVYKEKGKYGIAGDWATDMGLLELRFDDLSISEFICEATGHYKNMNFDFSIQDSESGNMIEMKEKIQKVGFSNWLALEGYKKSSFMGRFENIETRIDKRWINLDANELKSIIGYMYKNRNNLPFFNYAETVNIIKEKRGMVVEQAVNSLSLEELKYFIHLLRTLELGDVIIDIMERIDSPRITELSAGLSSARYLWESVISVYKDVLWEKYRAGFTYWAEWLEVSPFSYLEQERKVIEGIHALLIKHLPLAEAKYFSGLQSVYKKMALSGMDAQEEKSHFDFTASMMIAILKDRAGLDDFSFDIEFSPLVRESLVYNILTALRKSPGIFKLDLGVSGKKPWLKPDDYSKRLAKWREINPGLTEIFGDNFKRHKALDSLWQEVKRDVGHDSLAIAFIIGLAAFGMSFLSDFIRKKEMPGLYFGKTPQDIARQIREDNPWFDGEDPAAREFIEGLMQGGVSILTPEQMAQIDQFRNMLSEEERLIFDIVRAIAWESPEKAKESFMKRLLHLAPFLSAALSLRGPLAFRQRQEMNKELKSLAEDISENSGRKGVYGRFMEIMKRYGIGQDGNSWQSREKETTVSDFSILEEALRNAAKNPEKVVVYPSMNRFHPRENGYRQNSSGNNSDPIEMRDYVSGDDPRNIDWKASARRSRGLVVKMREQEKEKPVNIIVDMKGLLDVDRYQAGINDLVYSIKAIFMELRLGDKGGNYTLGQLIFLRPDTSYAQALLDVSNKSSFGEIVTMISGALRKEYEISRGIIEAMNISPHRAFYTEEENVRYSQRLKGISEGLVESGADKLKPFLLKPNDTYLAGFSEESKEAVWDLLRSKGILCMHWDGNRALIYQTGKSSSSVSAIGSVQDEVGGINLAVLPIQTESIASSALGVFPAVTAFKGDLDEEWGKIQSVFNAGIRPSIQRISEYTAAASASPLAEDKIDQIRVMLADILRRDEESQRLVLAEESCKQLLRALEAG